MNFKKPDLTIALAGFTAFLLVYAFGDARLPVLGFIYPGRFDDLSRLSKPNVYRAAINLNFYLLLLVWAVCRANQ